MSINLKQWPQLLGRLALPSDEETYNALLEAYGQPQRHYHSARHIGPCLTELDLARDQAAEPAEIEMALGFHDAVYDTHSSSNETLSARWAHRFLEAQGLLLARIERIVAHLLATCHSGTPADPDSPLTGNAGLAILGATPENYRPFESQIGQEYGWVPEEVFRAKRAEILESFLKRPASITRHSSASLTRRPRASTWRRPWACYAPLNGA